MIPFLLITFGISVWTLLTGTHDPALRIVLAPVACCAGALLLGRLYDLAVRA